MKPIVLVGHKHSCPIHSIGTVVSGAADVDVNGRMVARIGDQISCGAVIQTGSSNFSIGGQPVARQGDITSHGGVLIEGDAGWLVD